jgi:ABC-type transport system involved in cytochrome c biogenesis permease subunit
MKKYLPLLLPVFCALWVLSAWRTPSDKNGTIAINGFGRLPAIANGRVQPLDSLARNSLLQIREKQTASTGSSEGPARTLSASEWLLEVFFQQDKADTRPVFRILHTEVKGLLGLPLDPDPTRGMDGKHFSWNDFAPKIPDLMQEARRAQPIKSELQTPYDRAILHLWNAISLYRRLQSAAQPRDDTKDWERELGEFIAAIPTARSAAKSQQDGKPLDAKEAAALETVIHTLQHATEMQRFTPPFLIPPATPGAGPESWQRTDETLFQVAKGEAVPGALRAYAAMGAAFRAKDAGAFHAALEGYRQELGTNLHTVLGKCSSEQLFNTLEPFYKATVLYVLVGLCVMAFTLAPARFAFLRETALRLTLVTLVLHTAGLVFRMVLEGRPPVTNLYSSAVFIGWGACILGLLLERFWKNGIGLIASSTAGFTTLIIAHNLAQSGDTMEMMRAVLDTNFWLATHVVIVTLGYSATFVAGLLAVLYVVLGFFTRSLARESAQALSKMVYGIICFAALFSFIGTVLGGIWADQSWGRFWGWDAKENGALMIVLWNAIFLHARWGGMARERGLMALAIGGNIITAWSWFGVNMLGIGLHAYGFMSAAFNWLMLFVATQLVLAILALVPQRFWRSQPA